MTPEELDEARAREAWSRKMAGHYVSSADVATATEAARLAREGWEPTDPDLIEAREICAVIFENEGDPASASAIRGAREDITTEVQCALAALKRGRELERGPQ